MIYAQTIYLLISLYLIFKVVRKDYNLFHALIFVLPLHSWIYDIGLNLTAFQIVTLIMLLVSIFKGRNILYVGNMFIVVFLLFSIFGTIIISIFFIDEFLDIDGFFRSQGRFLSQLVLLVITFSIIPLAFNYMKNVRDVVKYSKVYLTALMLLVILGWVQYIIYSVTGQDIFPLNINEFGVVRSGLFDLGNTRIFRMSSLGGEPKGFSMSLVLGFYITHVFNKEGVIFFKYDRYIKYVYLVTAFATLSTSGMMLFSILLVVYTVYRIVQLGIRIEIDSKNIIFGSMIFFVASLLLMNYWGFVSSIIQQRVFDRNIVSEDFDYVIQMFLSMHPEYLIFGSGLGNIHNLAYPYIPSQFIHYMGDTIFVAKSGYLKIISELGVVGFLLFVGMTYSVYWKLGVNRQVLSSDDQKILSAIQVLLVIMLVAYLARNYVGGEFFIFLAMANAMVFCKPISKNIS